MEIQACELDLFGFAKVACGCVWGDLWEACGPRGFNWETLQLLRDLQPILLEENEESSETVGFGDWHSLKCDSRI